MAKNGFEVKVPMKKYLKKYLENKYGSPVQFPRECVEKDFLFTLLLYPRHRHDARLESTRYPAECRIVISEDQFHRYGFELTKTNAVRFNSILEELFKEKMRFYIMMHLRNMPQIAFVVERFRTEFKIEDDELTADGIKKDFQRYTKRTGINMRGRLGYKRFVEQVSREFDLSKI